MKEKILRSIHQVLFKLLTSICLISGSFAMIGDNRTSFQEYYEFARPQSGVVNIIRSVGTNQSKKVLSGTGFLLDTDDPMLKGRIIVTAAHVIDLEKDESDIVKIRFVDEDYNEKWIESQALYIHPAYRKNDYSTPDIGFILLTTPADLRHYRPLKINTQLSAQDLKNQEISTYGMSFFFGKANDCTILRELEKNL